MKNQLYILLIFGLIPVISISQQKKEVKTSVEVKVVKENEETKVVIRTNEDGKVKEEVFRGEEAEKKAEEIRGRYKVDEADDKKVEVRVEIINGQKVMTVSETTGDKVSVKVYQGDEVDEKLKEMDIKEPAKQKQ
jgi:hypothetical protein